MKHYFVTLFLLLCLFFLTNSANFDAKKRVANAKLERTAPEERDEQVRNTEAARHEDGNRKEQNGDNPPLMPLVQYFDTVPDEGDGGEFAAQAAAIKLSVIVPTYNRPAQLLRVAMHVLLEQTHKNLELIIIDDSDGDMCVNYPDDFAYMLDVDRDDPLLSKINYECQTPRRYSIGDKRNQAVEKATGRFFAFWDDDDLYSPNRLRNQLVSLLRLNGNISIALFSYILDLADEKGAVLYKIREPHKWGPHFGTLMIERKLYSEHGVRFPNTSYAEDLTFVQRANKVEGIMVIQKPVEWIYSRSRDNTWWEFSVQKTRGGLDECRMPTVFFPEAVRDVDDNGKPVLDAPPWLTAADCDFQRHISIQQSMTPDEYYGRPREEPAAGSEQKRKQRDDDAMVDDDDMAADSATARNRRRNRENFEELNANNAQAAPEEAIEPAPQGHDDL